MSALHESEPQILFDAAQKVNAWCCWHISEDPLPESPT